MSAKQQFTVTITDIHGARHYSFGQIVKKFVWLFVSLALIFVLGSAAAIWWLKDEVSTIETLKRQAEMSFLQALEERQNEYSNLVEEKTLLAIELENKVKQVGMLDQTLQGLEELMGVSPEVDVEIEERVKLIQLTTLEKQLMLESLPSGRPVLNFKGVSSGFGWRTHPITGNRVHHNGIDYRGPIGSPVIATADGIVEYAAFHKTSGYGNLIIINHAYGFKTLYGHLNHLKVKSGDFVKKGEVIGEIGTTGLSTGPHLHYEVNFISRKLNPSAFVQWTLDDYDEMFKKVEGVPWGSLSQLVRNRVEKVEKQLLLRDVQLMER